LYVIKPPVFVPVKQGLSPRDFKESFGDFLHRTLLPFYANIP
jgi:hypothetical protein